MKALLISVFIFVGSFASATDLGIGAVYETVAVAEVAKVVNEQSGSGYGWFVGLNAFFQEHNLEFCTKLKPEFIVLTRFNQPTGAGTGSVSVLYVQKVQCSWSEVYSKSFVVNVGFGGEAPVGEVEGVTPTNLEHL